MKLADKLPAGQWLVLGLGIALIVVTNMVALGGVAYNRAGQPEAVVTLSERELGMPYRYGMLRENTGIQLHLNCRIEDNPSYTYGYSDCSGIPEWFDRDKLIELGFGLRSESEADTDRRSYRSELPRPVYVVLEFDGPAYERAVVRAERDLAERLDLMVSNPGKAQFQSAAKQAQKTLDDERQHSSRLFVIDAGQDKSALQAKYTTTGRYIVMRALVRPLLRDTEQGEQWIGFVSGLLIDSINVPVQYHSIFEQFDTVRASDNPGGLAPRYEVQVAVGRRAEPWIQTVRKL